MVLKKKSKSKLFFISFVLISGTIFGSIIANNLDGLLIDNLSNSVKNFFSQNMKYVYESRVNLFANEFFKNIKTVLFLWVSGFMPFGNFFLSLILFLKGLSYGFTSSILFSVYKFKGIFYVLKFIFPTNFVLLLIFIFVANHSIRFLKSAQTQNKNLLKQNMIEHTFIFIFSVSCVFLITLANIYFLSWVQKIADT